MLGPSGGPKSQHVGFCRQKSISSAPGQHIVPFLFELSVPEALMSCGKRRSCADLGRQAEGAGAARRSKGRGAPSPRVSCSACKCRKPARQLRQRCSVRPASDTRVRTTNKHNAQHEW
eukprot:4023803-Pleurochrysis_carterae.AAC.1